MRRLRYRSIVDEADSRVSILSVLQWLGVSIEAPPEPGSNIRLLCPFEELNHSGNLRDRRQMRVYSDNRAYCFTGDTEFITRSGVRTLKECVDTDQWVLTPNHQFNGWNSRTEKTRFDGVWIKAPIRSFGVSPVLRVTVRRSRARKVIKATPNHRWVAGKHGRPFSIFETSSLVSGMSLASLSSQNYLSRASVSPFGVAHGFVFGDGSVEHGGSRVALWGEKDSALTSFFTGCDGKPVKTLNGVCGIEFRGLPKYFKSFPSLDEGHSYLMGWLAGYIAADGSVVGPGEVILESSEYENLCFARTVATELGLPTYGIVAHDRLGFGTEKSALYRLRFVPSHFPSEMLLIDAHHERFISNPTTGNKLRWTVESIEDCSEVEEVYCATVPETRLFTLADNILVGNCHECGCQYTPTSLIAMERGCSRTRAAQQLLGELEAQAPDPVISKLPIVRANMAAALAVWADAHGVERMENSYGEWVARLDRVESEEDALDWLEAAKRTLSHQPRNGVGRRVWRTGGGSR